ncbi:TetR/AcrR family transcriptional regulator [Jiangella aurantiaca]|uniref:TetR/AcrR family transcriptional regulator n=1 Tax=Jiangella aurantiaca TaxID=2530373 RepID=A0A4R5AI08_9ACTN|nr:TetR/AcrR family transcriptional regulator [Jiangella aurantiaca]TDD70969.1 TetR/AcrR family transcriptional regulator [Jiangella aurantiaca]
MTTDYSGGGDVSKSLELLWGMQQRPTRGPRPGLTLERIVEAAVAVADAEGLTALSMRRVAAHLGVGTMSLYRYVPGKAELLDLMLDHVAGPVDDVIEDDAAADAVGWRAALEEMARGIWQMCLDHPWYPQVDQVRPLLGPNNIAGMDRLLRRLKPTGLSDQQLVLMVSVVDGFVTAVARSQVNSLQAEQRTGITEEEFWAAQEPVLVKMMESGRFPTLAKLHEHTFTFSYEDVFEFGLKVVLDGLAVVVATGGKAMPGYLAARADEPHCE